MEYDNMLIVLLTAVTIFFISVVTIFYIYIKLIGYTKWAIVGALKMNWAFPYTFPRKSNLSDEQLEVRFRMAISRLRDGTYYRNNLMVNNISIGDERTLHLYLINKKTKSPICNYYRRERVLLNSENELIDEGVTLLNEFQLYSFISVYAYMFGGRYADFLTQYKKCSGECKSNCHIIINIIKAEML